MKNVKGECNSGMSETFSPATAGHSHSRQYNVEKQDIRNAV